MRRHLAAATCAGLAVMPVTVALAADDNDNENDNTAHAASHPERAELKREARAKLALAKRRHERKLERKRERRAKRTGSVAGGPSTASPQLQAIAACESGGNPRAIGGGGQFRGKYQFTYGTWASVGGSGDPAAAPEAEQDKRAAMLLARSGSSPWPVCG